MAQHERHSAFQWQFSGSRERSGQVETAQQCRAVLVVLGHAQMLEEGHGSGVGGFPVGAVPAGGFLEQAAQFAVELAARALTPVGGGLPGQQIFQPLLVRGQTGQSGGFGVVTLLLGAIRAEQEHRLVPVGECDAVDEGPQVAETAGGELNSGSETKLRVTGQFGVGFAIMEEMLCGDMTFNRSDEILCRNTVSYSVC